MGDLTGPDLQERFSNVTLDVIQYDWLNVFAVGESNQVNYQTTGTGFETVVTKPMAVGEKIVGELTISIEEDVGNASGLIILSYTASADGISAEASYSTISRNLTRVSGLRCRVIALGNSVAVQVRGAAGRTFNWEIKQNQGGNI